MQKIRPHCGNLCEWKFATKLASDCECDGLVHSGAVRCGYGLGWNSSSGSGFRFRRFLWEKLSCVLVQFNNFKGLFGFQVSVPEKKVPAVPVPRSVPGKTVPTLDTSNFCLDSRHVQVCVSVFVYA